MANDQLVTPWFSPTAYYDNNGVANPENVFVADGNYAQWTNAAHYVYYINFGFSLPLNAVLEGLEVGFLAYRGGGQTALDVTAFYDYLLGLGAGTRSTGDFGPSSPPIAYTLIGGNDDDWAKSWSLEDLANDKFALLVHATDGINNFVDHIRARWFYSEGPVDPPNKDFTCWNCAHFQPFLVASSTAGHCRVRAPNVSQGATLWPTISDGPAFWCSWWKRIKGDPPPIP